MAGRMQDEHSAARAMKTMAEVVESCLGETDGGYTFLATDNTERFLTWDELATEALRRGRKLLFLGLRKGDHVALIIPEGDEFVLTFFAAMTVGVIPVPMYPPLAFGKLDAYVDAATTILSAAQAKLLVTTKKVQNILWSLVDRVDSMQTLTTTEALGEPLPRNAPQPEVVAPEDAVFLQFTSGSTAAPKGVRITHASLLANCHGIMSDTLRSVRETDKGVTWLPMYHDMGLIGFVLAPLVYRIPVVFIPTLLFIKSPTVWMETVSRHRGTITFAPNFAFALATKRTPERKLSGLDLSSLKALGCGAEPNHPGTLNAFLDHFAAAGLKRKALLPCYGMAEATLAMSFIGLDEEMGTDVIDGEAYHAAGIANATSAGDADGSVEFVSCGRALPGHELVILDDSGNPLPDRRVGDVIFRGPSTADGYHADPEATREIFSDVGLRTGDLGYLVDGVLYVTGRKKDVLILNGRNYDPQTVEWAAAEIEGVRKGNVVAFTRPARTTEELVIVAETREKDVARLTEAVRSRVQGRLSIPVAEILFLGPGQLPKTSSGKLQRRKTQQHYLAGKLGRDGVRTLGGRGDALVVAKHVASSLVSRVCHGIKDKASSLLESGGSDSQAS